MLIQLEPIYASILQQYTHILRQRNALLRQETGVKSQVATANPSPTSELALWDAQLAVAGTRVIRRRSRVVQRIAPLATYWHREISGSTEELMISYVPNVELQSDDPTIVQQTFLAKIQSG